MKETKMTTKVSNLLNEIIKKAEEQDAFYKKQMIAAHKANLAVGESWLVFHLKALKELLEMDK